MRSLFELEPCKPCPSTPHHQFLTILGKNMPGLGVVNMVPVGFYSTIKSSRADRKTCSRCCQTMLIQLVETLFIQLLCRLYSETCLWCHPLGLNEVAAVERWHGLYSYLYTSWQWNLSIVVWYSIERWPHYIQWRFHCTKFVSTVCTERVLMM